MRLLSLAVFAVLAVTIAESKKKKRKGGIDTAGIEDQLQKAMKDAGVAGNAGIANNIQDKLKNVMKGVGAMGGTADVSDMKMKKMSKEEAEKQDEGMVKISMLDDEGRDDPNFGSKLSDAMSTGIMEAQMKAGAAQMKAGAEKKSRAGKGGKGGEPEGKGSEPELTAEEKFRANQKVQGMLNMVDTDKDGLITKDEFSRMIQMVELHKEKGDPMRYWDLMDKDKDKKVTSKEFIDMWEPLIGWGDKQQAEEGRGGNPWTEKQKAEL